MLEILMWFGILIIPVFLLIDLVQGARKYDTPKFWKTRCLAVTVTAVFISYNVAGFWEGVIGDFTLFDNSSLPLPVGILLGILTYNFCHYWYHRTMHKYDALWLLTHQMHHSAEGIDSFSAYYLHPMDVVMFTTIGSMVFFPFLGLSLEAGLWALAFNGFNAIFQHVNIRTPHWLGYIVQRPESHCIHHEKGLHAYNYADLPLMDIIFGTFKNPKDEAYPEAGFYNGASNRLLDMLFFKAVHEPKDQETEPQKKEALAE